MSETVDKIMDQKEQVNHPAHYNQGGIECIAALEAMLTREEMIGALKFQVVKYTWRAGLKDAVAQDIAKAGWYQKYLEDFLKRTST